MLQRWLKLCLVAFARDLTTAVSCTCWDWVPGPLGSSRMGTLGRAHGRNLCSVGNVVRKLDPLAIAGELQMVSLEALLGQITRFGAQTISIPWHKSDNPSELGEVGWGRGACGTKSNFSGRPACVYPHPPPWLAKIDQETSAVAPATHVAPLWNSGKLSP
jgi:hypothetical protein